MRGILSFCPIRLICYAPAIIDGCVRNQLILLIRLELWIGNEMMLVLTQYVLWIQFGSKNARRFVLYSSRYAEALTHHFAMRYPCVSYAPNSTIIAYSLFVSVHVCGCVWVCVTRALQHLVWFFPVIVYVGPSTLEIEQHSIMYHGYWRYCVCRNRSSIRFQTKIMYMPAQLEKKVRQIVIYTYHRTLWAHRHWLKKIETGTTR